jgi:UDPglucose 6-dehydrogenase
MKDAMRTPLVLDGRNLYEPHAMAQGGFTYLGIGRNNRALLPPQERVAPEPSAAADALGAATSALLADQAR